MLACPLCRLQITSRYGTEANKAAVDFNVYGPDGNSVHKEEGVSETEIAGAAGGAAPTSGRTVHIGQPQPAGLGVGKGRRATRAVGGQAGAQQA